MTVNWSFHRMATLPAEFQRYSIGYGGYGLVPALCALRLEHLLDAQTWLIEAAEVRFKHQKCL